MLLLGVGSCVDHLLEQAYPQHTHLLERELERGDGHIPELGEITIVEAHHPNLPGNLAASLLQS